MRRFSPLLLFAIVLVLSRVAYSGDLPQYDTSSLNKNTHKLLLSDGWKVYRGDVDRIPAIPSDVEGWAPIDTDGPFNLIVYDGDGSVFWYANPFVLSEDLQQEPLYLIVDQIGAMVVYCNGVPVHHAYAGDDTSSTEGWVYSISDMLAAIPEPADTMLLAVKFQNLRAKDHAILKQVLPGFRLSILPGELARHKFNVSQNKQIGLLMLLVGFSLAFALLHLLVFFFFPKTHVYLHYTGFTASVTLLMILIVYSRTTMNFSNYLNLGYGFKLALVLICITGVRFMLGVQGLRNRFSDLTSIALVPIGAFLVWKGTFVATYILVLLSVLGWMISLIVAHVRKMRGSWILTLGFGAFGITGIQQAFYVLGILTPNESGRDEVIMLLGLLLLLASIALYLARQFAQTNKDLEQKIEEVGNLSERTIEQERIAREQEMERLRLTEENRRRQVELEESRKRQAVLEELEEAYTQLRQTQSQLIQTEKMASLGRLVAGIAHEINTPVGAVNSMKDTLQRAFGKMKELLASEEFENSTCQPQANRLVGVIDDAIRVIGSGTDRVSEIVRRLRSFARLDEAELKSIDLNGAIEDTISLVRHELAGRVEVVRDFGDVGTFACFPARLNQVILNLVMNSVQAINGPGTVTIRTRRLENTVQIVVEDTGSGISEDRIGKIFDPGYTTKGVGIGTGLGLAITFRIIQEHRGEIEVESTVGTGTTFTITLPSNLPDLLEIDKKGEESGSLFPAVGGAES